MDPLRLRRLILGYGLLALGLLGFVLPLLQGWLFVALGLVLLKQDAVWAMRCFSALRKRFPQARPVFDSVDRQTERLLIRFKLKKKPLK